MGTHWGALFDQPRPLSLRNLPLPKDLHVLVLAPHPDDFDAIGVTLRLLRDKGNPIHVAVLTSGAGGVEDHFGSPQLTPAGKATLREEEQAASCRSFGLPPAHLTFLHLAEDGAGHLEDSEANLARLRRYWDAQLPDLVFTPHGHDTNAAHRRTCRLVRQLASVQPRPLAVLLNRDPKTITLRPDVYTAFAEAEAQWKGALLRFHQTQQQRNLRTRQYGFDERILRDNRAAAAAVGQGAAYAEVFELEWYAGESKGSGGVRA